MVGTGGWVGGRQNVHSQDRGGSEEPLITQVQLVGPAPGAGRDLLPPTKVAVLPARADDASRPSVHARWSAGAIGAPGRQWRKEGMGVVPGSHLVQPPLRPSAPQPALTLSPAP